MADPGGTYRKAVIRARFEVRGVPPEEEWGDLTDLEREVAEEMGETAGSAQEGLARIDMAHVVLLGSVYESFPDDPLTPDRIKQIENGARQAFAQHSVEIENVLTGTRSRSREKIVQAHQNGLNRAGAQAGMEVSDEAIAGMMQRIRDRANGRRQFEESAVQVVRRRTTQANEATVSWIRGQQGRPGRKAAREWVARMSEHSRIREAIESAGPRGENIRRAIERAGRAAEDLQDDAVNLYSNAKRAYVHETNLALHEADVLAAEESPAVNAVKWSVSARHPTLESSPDVCDVLEDADLHGLGNGLYHPGSCPTLPHVYCECGMIPQTVPPSQWGEIKYSKDQAPNREPIEPGTDDVAEAMRRRLTAESGPVTQAKAQRTTEQLNRAVQVAYDRWIDF